MSDHASNLVGLTGLWRKEGKNGVYLTGTLGRGRMLIFPNGKKSKETDPDYFVYLAPNEPKEKQVAEKKKDFSEF